MENYEQKYKEALKIIESLYNVVRYQSSSDALLASQTIEKAFPELVESEDERIRKEIIQSIKDNMSVIHKDKCLAWLEKQGASIDVDYFLNKVGIKSAYKDGNAWCILFGDNIQDGICGFGYTKEEALIEFLKDLLEKQGEHISSL